MPWFASAAWPSDHRDEVVAAALVGSVVIILGYSIGVGSGTAFERTVHAVRVVQEPVVAPGGAAGTGGGPGPTSAPAGGGGLVLGLGAGAVPGAVTVTVPSAPAYPATTAPTTAAAAPTSGPTGAPTSGPTSPSTSPTTPPGTSTGTGLPLVGGLLNGVVCTLTDPSALGGLLQPIAGLLGSVTTPLAGACATTAPAAGATP